MKKAFYSLVLVFAIAAVGLAAAPATVIQVRSRTDNLAQDLGQQREVGGSLSFSYQIGGNTPPSQIVSLSSGPSNGTFSAVASGGTWLSVSTTGRFSPTGTATITVSVNPGSLGVGTYPLGRITISGPQILNDVIAVSLTITACVPSLSVSPSSLSFTHTIGSSTPSLKSISVSSSCPLNYTVTKTGSWLLATPSSGSTSSGTVTASVNPAGLTAGNYSGSIIITGANGDFRTVAVGLSVQPAPTPSLSISTNALNFTYSTGGAVPSPQSFTVGSTSTTLSYSVSGGGSWLSYSPSSGATPGTVRVSVNPAGLSPGTYSATLSISSAGASNSPQSVSISLSVAGPLLSAPTGIVTFTYQIGGVSPSPWAIDVSSTGSPLSITAAAVTISGGPWLSISPSGGTTPVTLIASAKPASLAAGTYNGNITISSPQASNSPISVPVQLVVTSSPPLTVSPSSLSFSYNPGSPGPVPQSLSVSLGVAGTFTAAAATISGGSWLSVSPSSGTTPATLSVSVNTLGLSTGTHSGSITVTSSSTSTSPVVIPVQIVVGSAPPPLAVSPSSLTFNYSTGGPTPAAQSFNVTSGSAAINYTLSWSGGSWLSASANNGSTPGTVSVNVNPAGLSPGTYQGTVSVADSGSPNTSQSVAVTLNVQASQTCTVIASPNPLVFDLTGGTSQNLPLTLSPSGNCAGVTYIARTSTFWLTIAPSSNSLPDTLSVTANPAQLQESRSDGAITIILSGASNSQVQIPVSANIRRPETCVVTASEQTVSVELAPRATRRIPITLTSSGLCAEVTYSAVTASSWVSVSPPAGPIPSTISIDIGASGMTREKDTATVDLFFYGEATIKPITIQVAARVTEVPAPKSIEFTYSPDGGTLRMPTCIQIGDAPGSEVLVSFVSTGSQNWMRLDVNRMTAPGTLCGAADASGLSTGSYLGFILISPVNSSAAPKAIPARLQVLQPRLNAAPGALNFTYRFGGTLPTEDTVMVTAPTNRTYSVSSQASWLTAQSTSDMTNSQVAVRVNPAGLAVGVYRANVLIQDAATPGTPIAIPVTLTIEASNLAIPQIADGGGWKTILTLANRDAVQAQYTIRFREPNGEPLFLSIEGVGPVSEISGRIPVGGRRTIETQGLANMTNQGWAEVVSSQLIGGTAIFRQATPSGRDSEAAVLIAPANVSNFSLPFDNSAGFVTSMAIVNPDPAQSTDIAIVIRDRDGRLLGQENLTLKSRSRIAIAIQDRFPAARGIQGVLELQSKLPASVFGLRFNPGGSFTSFKGIAAGGTVGNVVALPSVVSQIAAGGDWKTILNVVNTTESVTPYVLRFWRQDGSPMTLALDGMAANTDYVGVLQPHGSQTLATSPAAALTQGWAELIARNGVGGTAVFGTLSNGYSSEGAVNIEAPTGPRFQIPFDNTKNFVTSLAVLNTSSTAASVSVRFRDEDGTLLGSATIPLDAGTQNAFELPTRFPATANRRGITEFSGTTAGVSALGFRFNPAGAFTSIDVLGR